MTIATRARQRFGIRRAATLGVVALGLLALGLGPLAPASGARGKKRHRCAPIRNGHSGPGHFRFIRSACENFSITAATFPLHRGISHGRTVWYVITDDSNRADARRRGVNYVPKLRNAIGTGAIERVTIVHGVVDFPATVNFRPRHVLVAGRHGFPPKRAKPGAVGNRGYSPLIELPDGTVLNAPQVANRTGRADKLLSINFRRRTVTYKETEGFYEDKHVHYASFDASNPIAAAIEDVTYAPALGKLPRAGDEGLATSSREELVAFINGPTGKRNPYRQGINSAILAHQDPHNILHETPVLAKHADVGDIHYAPMWDVHFAQWTRHAIAAGDRVELRSVDEVNQRVAEGLVTGPGGTAFGPTGIVVNCPLISIDIP